MEQITNVLVIILLITLIIISVLFLRWFFLWLLIFKNAYRIHRYKEKNKLDLALEEKNNYIIFEHKGDFGLGVVYNSGTEEDKYIVVAMAYSQGATQHLPLNEIDKYRFIDIKELKKNLN